MGERKKERKRRRKRHETEEEDDDDDMVDEEDENVELFDDVGDVEKGYLNKGENAQFVVLHQAQQFALQQQAQQQMMQNGNTFYNGLQHQMMNVNGSFTTNNNHSAYNQTLQSVQNAHTNVNY